MQGDSLYEMMYTFPQFAKSPGPRSLSHRYFSEDIAYGLVPMSSLAGAVGVEMPLTRALIDLAGCLCNEDFRKTGRDLSDFSRASMRNVILIFAERITLTVTHKERRRR